MDLSRVEELVERGLYLQAYREGLEHAPLERWSGVAGRTLAGRLARHLGAARLSHRLFMLAYRRDRAAPEALYYYAFSLLQRRGPLAAWRFVQTRGIPPNADGEARSDWFCLHAVTLGALRDFDRAEDWLRRAEELTPQRLWIAIERGALCFAADDLDGALAAGRRALERKPWYRPAVECVASALVQLQREEEALDLLREASERLESAAVTGRLLSILVHRSLHEEADRAAKRVERLMPLASPEARQWLAGLRSDLAYHRGDLEGAHQLLEDAGDGFYGEIRKRLAVADPRPAAVRLEVPFVRQDYLTCAPATLASIGAYWSSPVSQAEIAQSICYGGTPDHVERHWAESNGWRVREFSVDWDSARALLDRGVPFSFATVAPGSAHLQAIIGYDARRGTALLRDPSGYTLGECIAVDFFDSYRSTGPRGMALVPPGETHRLAGLALPDEAVYDLVYTLKRNLADHRREDAERQCQQLTRDHPHHMLTAGSRYELAIYDGDLVAALHAIEELLRRFPNDQPLALRRVRLLRDLHHREAALEALNEILEREDADGIFWQQRAEVLRGDARHGPAAEADLQRALRARPTDPYIYSSLAALRVAEHRFDVALDLYRFAACLSPTDEAPSQAYFQACRASGEPETGLVFLRRRAERAAEQSGQPSITLAWALGCLWRQTEGLEALEEAMRIRPDDAELWLSAAAEYGRAGDGARARELHAKAEGQVKRSAWLRVGAELAGLEGRGEEALAMWRRVCDVEPMDDALARQVADQIALTEGPGAVATFFGEALARAPRNIELHVSWVQWLRNRERDRAAEEAAHLTQQHPRSARVWLTLGEILLDQRRLDEAENAAEQALQRDPLDPGGSVLHARVAMARGDNAKAAESLRTALHRTIDVPDAIQLLVQCYDTDVGRRDALDFVRVELERQVVFGAGLVAYRTAARAVLEPGAVARLLEEMCTARPDLWQAWSESTLQLTEMGNLDEALRLARAATERFPLVPEAWSDLARVHQLRSDTEGQRRALEKALEVHPTWGWVLRELTLLHRGAGRLAEARETIDRAIRCTPLEETNFGCLAEVQWAGGEESAALDSLRRAVELNPDYAWAWHRLHHGGAELGTPEEAARIADRLVARRPDDVRSWLAVARIHVGPATLEKRLDALAQAVTCDPHNIEVYDWEATELAEAGRFEEALAACRPEAFGAVPPIPLRGRATWIEACRGHRSEAITAMYKLVQEDPAYAWGWWQLALWLAEERRWELAAEAANRRVRVDPGNADAWLLSGRLDLQLGHRNAARAAFRRALDLEPDGCEAGFQLFDLYLEKGDVEGALETLDRVSPYAPADELLARKLQAALSSQKPDAALGYFRQLCRAPGDDPEPLERASRMLAASSHTRKRRDRILDEALDREAIPLRTLALCSERAAQKRLRWRKYEKRFVHACGRTETGMLALAQYLERLVELRRRHRLHRLIARERKRIRANTRCWGSVGYALAYLEPPLKAIAWLADWKTRADLEPWMLHNLVITLRVLGRWPEASRVGQHALQLEVDPTRPQHATWLALDAALEGDRRESERLLELAVPQPEPVLYRHLTALTQLLLTAHPHRRDRAAARRAERAVLSAARRAARKIPLLRLPRRRVARELRRRRRVRPSSSGAGSGARRDARRRRRARDRRSQALQMRDGAGST